MEKFIIFIIIIIFVTIVVVVIVIIIIIIIIFIFISIIIIINSVTYDFLIYCFFLFLAHEYLIKLILVRYFINVKNECKKII